MLRRRVERAGPVAIGVVTAHPAGPLTWVAWAAGLSSIPLLGFAAAVVLGGTVRSFTYAVFGAALTDVRSPRFLVASGVLAAVVLLPLVHPGIRRRLVSRLRAS